MFNLLMEIAPHLIDNFKNRDTTKVEEVLKSASKSILGTDDLDKAFEMVKASPEQKKQMQDAANKELDLLLKDVQHARETLGLTPLHYIFFAWSSLMFTYALYSVTHLEIPAGNGEEFNMLLIVVTSCITGWIGYLLGTQKSNK